MAIGPWQIIIIVLAIIILFGGKKIPEIARGIGLGLKEFKKATKEIKDEVNNASDSVSDDKNSDWLNIFIFRNILFNDKYDNDQWNFMILII